MTQKILDEATWQSQKQQLEQEVENLLGKYFANREHGIKHPVIDFLFDYYSYRFIYLKKWNPGYQVFLQGKAAEEFLQNELFCECSWGIGLDIKKFPKQRRSSVNWVITLLENTQQRLPFFNCFGLHEWAMVYKIKPRHQSIPLRMSPENLAEFVESQQICCSHFDAFRFFSPAARPLNRLQPTKPQFHQLEQPGCLHSNMDLYKWAYKFAPWISSDLIWQTFQLAYEIRTLDMQASPYDLRDFGYQPVCIETKEGRKQYVQRQQQIYEKAQPLRLSLLEAFQKLQSALDGS